MSNIHTSTSDVAYQQILDKKYEALMSKYSEWLESATTEGQSHMKTKISNKLQASQRILYSDAKLQNDISNHFKFNLITRFAEVLLERRENPVKHFLELDLPKIRRTHKEYNRRSIYSYSYDNAFFKASQDHVIELLANFQALKKCNDTLLSENESNLGSPPKNHAVQIPIIKPDIKHDVIIETIFTTLTIQFGKVTLEEFRRHFEPNTQSETKIQWFGTKVVLVHLFYELERIKVIPAANCPKYIASHFLDKNGDVIKSSEVSTQYHQIKCNTRGRKIVDALIKNLQSM